MEETEANGVKFWIPIDESDKMLLQISEGATFSETVFPSGWVSPNGKQISQGGKLVDVR